MGATVDRPLVGETEAGSIAEQAGFEKRDEVLKVGDRSIQSWNEFRLAILDQGLDGGTISILVRNIDGVESRRELALGELRLLENEGDIFNVIGFSQWWPQLTAEIGGVIEKSAAENAGLQKNDVVLQVDGVEIDQWLSLVKMIREKPNKAMQFVVLRDGIKKSLTVIPQSRKNKDGEQGFIGADRKSVV